ncbi:MAG: hypothetical protein JW778_06595 [Candidatus Altiarchaeota archaeon]|nr:hypothetical protein [Candidatus Altiarchaeota archaeon]
MQASHYVLEKILAKWGDLNELRDEFEKFSKRYPDDPELQRVYKDFQHYLKLNSEHFGDIKEKLRLLEENRRA